MGFDQCSVMKRSWPLHAVSSADSCGPPWFGPAPRPRTTPKALSIRISRRFCDHGTLALSASDSRVTDCSVLERLTPPGTHAPSLGSSLWLVLHSVASVVIFHLHDLGIRSTSHRFNLPRLLRRTIFGVARGGFRRGLSLLVGSVVMFHLHDPGIRSASASI